MNESNNHINIDESLQIFSSDVDIDFLIMESPEHATLSQLKKIVELEAFAEEHIRIMPDVHGAKSSVVGFTSTLSTDKIIPNIVSGDIGCGVFAVEFKPSKKGIDFVKLDKFLHETIGDNRFVGRADDMPFDLNELECADELPNKNTIPSSMGTLGGGNHFVEVDYDVADKKWYLLIHTGSRNLGTQIAKLYQNVADCGGDTGNIPYDLRWTTGDTAKQYMHDLELAQHFAQTNRRSIAKSILKAMKWKEVDSFDTMHNYIDMSGDVPIIRKGAVSAKQGEKLIIPMNMAFGSFVCIGNGNEHWNQSAPHGAGRLMSRSDAKETLAMNEYKKAMKDVFSTSVNNDTIDEAPGAYKHPDSIASVLGEVVDIDAHIVSKYNFKN